MKHLKKREGERGQQAWPRQPPATTTGCISEKKTMAYGQTRDQDFRSRLWVTRSHHAEQPLPPYLQSCIRNTEPGRLRFQALAKHCCHLQGNLQHKRLTQPRGWECCFYFHLQFPLNSSDTGKMFRVFAHNFSTLLKITLGKRSHHSKEE